MAAQVRIHAVFSCPSPQPIFLIAVEVLEGEVSTGMYVQCPFSNGLTFTVEIIGVAPIANSHRIPLLGLSLLCADGRNGLHMNESLFSSACNHVFIVSDNGGI